MNTVLRELAKHIRIYFLFMKNSFIAQLEYRANFVTGILMELGYLFAKIMYVIVIYRSGKEINGLPPDAVLIFIGTFVIVTGFYAGLFMMNNFAFRNHVRTGELDLLITKPVSLQFMLTLRRSDLGILTVDVIGGAIMVAIGWSRLSLPFDLLNAVGFLGFLVGGTVTGYSIFLFPQIFSFWLTDISAIAETTDAFWDFNNVPMVVYDRIVERIGVFVVPIFVVTNFPALFLLRRMNWVYAVWGVVAPILLLTLVRLFWNKAVKNYSSASS